VQLVIFLVLLVLMYAVLIVPQQRRVKAQRAILSSLAEGDVVLTSAGIYGVITEMTDGDVYLEVAEGFQAFVEEFPDANARGDTLDEARRNLLTAVRDLFDINRDLAESNLSLANVPFRKEALAAC